MTTDVTDLFHFYNTSLGELVTSRLGDVIHRFHKHSHASHLVGIGYTVPYAQFDLNLVPDHIGVMQMGALNKTVMMDEGCFPLGNEAVEAMVLIHMLEHAQNPKVFLREVWRSLTPGGRVLIIVPNRRGMWSRFENNPFGHGQPFSKRQIVNLLEDNLFTCVGVNYALSTFPINHPLITTHLPTLPYLPKIFLNRFSGIIVVEAIKQVCAVQPKRKLKTRLVPRMISHSFC